MAESASDRELLADIEYLRKLWGGIQDKAQDGRAARVCSTRTST